MSYLVGETVILSNHVRLEIYSFFFPQNLFSLLPYVIVAGKKKRVLIPQILTEADISLNFFDKMMYFMTHDIP